MKALALKSNSITRIKLMINEILVLKREIMYKLNVSIHAVTSPSTTL